MSYADHRSMQGLSLEAQSTRAIAHLLRRLRSDDRVYHLIGSGSESFDLLTEAYASLTGTDLGELRRWLASTTPGQAPANSGL